MAKNYVYIMSNKHRTTYYVGVTNNLWRRRLEHRAEGPGDGFCGKYKICDVIYREDFDRITDAIRREKQIKAYSKARRLDLIRQLNPTLATLAPPFFHFPNPSER